jgi:hypothetical protein
VHGNIVSLVRTTAQAHPRFTLAGAVAAALAISTATLAVAAPAAPPPAARAKPDELSRARALDKEGARAYAEGRYRDAIRDFDEAYRLGGPAFELWNVAKCHLRLEEPEQAAEMLEKYLALPNLPREDRDEAAQQLELLKKRPSTLTVSSTPSGAQVAVDGKNVDGRTPVSVPVAAGTHTVTVSSAAGAPYTKQIEARFGRPVIVEGGAEARPPPPDNPYVVQTSAPIVLRGALGVVFPRFGTIGGRAGIGFTALATYRVAQMGSRGGGAEAGSAGSRSEGGPALAIGGLLSISGDSWSNRTGAPNAAADCAGALHNPQSATALSLFGIGTATFPLARDLRATALGGLGIATYLVDDLGGDLFVPSCTRAPGPRPALLLGTRVDYAVTPFVRISAFPLTWQVQPAFDGTRASPHDASGVWMRFGVGVGAGVDL